MNLEQQRLIQKAQKSLEASKRLNNTHCPKFAISRA